MSEQLYDALMPPAWPEDEYLLRLGKVVFSMASIEGLLIFDLPRMPATIEGLSPKDLAGETTAMMGKRLLTLAPSIGEPDWREFFERGSEALVDLGPKRNSVLHSRPATIDDEQRLHRWRPHPTEIMSISRAHLDQVLDDIENHQRALNLLRPRLN